MTDDVKSYISIAGQTFDASAVDHPTEKTFRGAWEHDGEAIVVNMDKAREIQADAIRRERAEVLPGLDADFMKALETGADTSAIAAQKKLLRDAPQHRLIAEATTPEELAEVNLAAIMEAEATASDITQASDDLTGGPTLREVFDGNEGNNSGGQ